jgi:hypothetical protein
VTADIKRLLSNHLSEFSGLGVTAKFQRGLEKLDERADELDDTDPTSPRSEMPEPESDGESAAGAPAGDSDHQTTNYPPLPTPSASEPLVRFLDAYQNVEREALDAIRRRSVTPVPRSLSGMASVLFDETRPDHAAVLVVIREFMNLRNQVVHGRARVTNSDADQFEEVALKLINNFRKLQ